MKPAFGYYGGKQRMAGNIVPLLPKHTVYVEPFAGGAAVFFAKPGPEVTDHATYREVLNDHDNRIVNFYRVLREQPDALIRACCLTPYSREEHKNAIDDESLSEVERARRWFVDINQSFSNKSRAGWSKSDFGEQHAATWERKAANLYAVADRLMSVYIEHDDALNVIQRWDSPQTLFYCDPPYPGAHQGHYSGYTLADFAKLVDALNTCDGSFLLSNYDQSDIPEHWERFEFKVKCSACLRKKVNRDEEDDIQQQQQLTLYDRNEILWRVIRGDNVRPEIKQLYQSGQFDCFI